jgi:hypothetical protein
MDLSTDTLWMNGRFYPDLAPAAELALRRAGALYHQESEARRELDLAQALAPEHLAVWVARYRFHFYKHQYVEAEVCARECLALVGRTLGLPSDLGAVQADTLGLIQDEPALRFWLFGWQAYGYVLLRLGREVEGRQVLACLADLDALDLTKTRVLLQVMTAPPDDD